MKNGRVPVWMESFLADSYFADCSHHGQFVKRERNFFCVDCQKGPLCDTGKNIDHNGHFLLQVRKASHADAVRVEDIAKLVDISHIQTFSINSARIVFLPSRPQARPMKTGSNCRICLRSLADTSSLFCSLSCKMQAILQSPSDEMLTMMAYPTPLAEHAVPITPPPTKASKKRPPPVSPHSVLEMNGNHGSPELPRLSSPNSGYGCVHSREATPAYDAGSSFRKRSRKGMPVRAPFF